MGVQKKTMKDLRGFIKTTIREFLNENKNNSELKHAEGIQK